MTDQAQSQGNGSNAPIGEVDQVTGALKKHLHTLHGIMQKNLDENIAAISNVKDTLSSRYNVLLNTVDEFGEMIKHVSVGEATRMQKVIDVHDTALKNLEAAIGTEHPSGTISAD